MVDQVLGPHQKANFDTSEINKCWGHYDIQIGGLRLTYQDFRLNQPIKADTTKNKEENGSFTSSYMCHNKKIVSADQDLLDRNGSLYLQHYVFGEEAVAARGGRYPDVIYSNPMMMWNMAQGETPSMEHVISKLGLAVAEHLRPLAALLPKSWKGKWVISAYEGMV